MDDCEDLRCTRINGRCVSMHCVVCGEPCSSYGHPRCVATPMPAGPNGAVAVGQPIVGERTHHTCGPFCPCGHLESETVMRVPAGGRIYRAADYDTPPYTPGSGSR